MTENTKSFNMTI